MATDIFAKIGDIKGESLDAKHKDEIEVFSFSWGVANSGSAAPGEEGAGKATFQDLSIVHGIDKATPDWKACATGLRIKDATITHRSGAKAAGVPHHQADGCYMTAVSYAAPRTSHTPSPSA